jgi:hypothetical protein
LKNAKKNKFLLLLLCSFILEKRSLKKRSGKNQILPDILPQIIFFLFFLNRKLLKNLRISGSELGERLFQKKNKASNMFASTSQMKPILGKLSNAKLF